MIFIFTFFYILVNITSNTCLVSLARLIEYFHEPGEILLWVLMAVARFLAYTDCVLILVVMQQYGRIHFTHRGSLPKIF